MENHHHHSLPLVKPVPGKYTPPVRTQARAATILPSFVGMNFEIYNGKVYIPVTITEDMVGHKLGEFSQYVFLFLFIVCPTVQASTRTHTPASNGASLRGWG
jgi:ribosomal protein S19